MTGDRLVVPSDDRSAHKWSFTPKEMRINPEVTLQAVLTSSPTWVQAGQWELGMVIYKRAWSSEAVKSKGNKGVFMSFWFLEETRLGRAHSQSAHLWFSVHSLLLSLPITPSPLGQFLLDPKGRRDMRLMTFRSQGSRWQAQLWMKGSFWFLCRAVAQYGKHCVQTCPLRCPSATAFAYS